jgi:hypothetical protein
MMPALALFSKTHARRRSADPIDAVPEPIVSRLLPELLEGIEERERLVVLDVGGGVQSTLDFLGRYNNTNIHFVDLFSSPLLIDPPEEMDSQEACQAFREYLCLPDDLTFDVCLFWDILHRVDLPVLQGLSQALHPHLHEDTLGYAFGTLHGGALDDLRYGIHDLDHLTAHAIQSPGRFFAHTQKQISEHFGSFEILRSTLLRTGRLELLLAA